MEYNDNLIELIIRLSRTLKGKMGFDTKTAHLTSLQLQALILLKNKSNMQMKDVANKFKVKMSTATSLVDRLSCGKLVLRKEGSKDRRIVQISLTKKGEALISDALAQRRKVINSVLSYITKEDKKTLFRILKSISAKIEEDYESKK